MTKEEKIAAVEAKIDGHTQPPQRLYYPNQDGTYYLGRSTYSRTYCINEKHPFSSNGGICEICFLVEKRKGKTCQNQQTKK
jgi:hypothetical protein